ncbi:MAG TPA: hypothetical protein ENF77_03120, partial [Candidatus Acetothermia bacterium]|nr:hypothetical protein [Candidatus Acetothermia bacterium]
MQPWLHYERKGRLGAQGQAPGIFVPRGGQGMYTCRFCGYRAERPVAYCPRCGAWKAFQKESEETVRPVPLVHIPLGAPLRGLDVGPLGGLLEMGLPRGAVVLLGGEPGVGKSTLLLQIASSLAREFPVL